MSNDLIEDYLSIIHESHPVHRRRAIRKRINILKKKQEMCGNKKESQKCKDKYGKRINVLSTKLSKLSNLRI